ncbi:MAG: trypsin-like peptidase domain-containing protein [Dehalococcoidia bacterium]|nr:trypsin-like peptidase domain-containing protein [Dehalococcoidia bacterium]
MIDEPQFTATPARKGIARRFTSLVVAGLLLLGMVGGGAIGSAATIRWLSEQPPITQQVRTLVPISVGDSAKAATETSSITAIYKAVSPAVVSVNVASQSRGSTANTEAEGSGFIVDGQGQILTNNHVIQGAQKIVVILLDGTKLEAKVVGTDPASDLALLKVDLPKDKIVIAALGDSDKVQPGEMAIAIGNPFGLAHTLTTGIVSAIDREFGKAGGRPMRGLIQTDAPINPGNSGGPLFNAQGEVIGITTSIESPVRGSVGIGFAIPINKAKALLPSLQKGAQIDHPYLGISGIAITSDLATTQKLPVTSGVLVADVVKDGPSAKAGLKGGTGASTDTPTGGDIITAVDSKAVKTVPELSSYLDTKRVGDKVTLTVIRDGKTIQVDVTLGAWPATLSQG